MLQKLIERRHKGNEEGFTLIELMVVVLIIAILIAIAIPTFLGARTRAQDRQAQSNLRNAFAAEKVVFTDNQAYTTNTATLSGIEPSLNYSAVAAVSGATDAKEIHVAVDATTGAVTLGAKSKSGECFYMQDAANAPTQFAKDKNCGALPEATPPAAEGGWTSAW